MLIGAGALHATQEVIEVADALGAGVAKALLGKAAVPDDLPFVTGSIGLLGTRPSWELMQDCDTLLMVGSSFPYSEFLPEEGEARGVQIDLDGRMLGIRYPMEVNLVGDSALTLKALLPLLERKQDRSWREKIEGNVADWWQVIERRALEPAEPVNPQLIFHELSKRLPDGAILTSDSGSAANWYARDVRLRAGMLATLSGTLATMGPGVPYAIAAKFAYPDRPVIALVGDGAMQMNGLAELITIAKYRERWSDQRLIVMVLNNRDLNQVTWEQRAMSGDPKFVESQELPDVPYAQLGAAARPERHPNRRSRRDRGVLGSRARKRRCRPCWRSCATRRFRRCRRTSRSSRPAPSPPRSGTATRPAGGSSRRRSARSSRRSCTVARVDELGSHA